MMRLSHLCAIGALLLAAGCESDAAKLERLQGEEVTARLTARRWELRVEAARARASGHAPITTAYGAPDPADTIAVGPALDSLSAARTRATLAARELRRFLGPN